MSRSPFSFAQALKLVDEQGASAGLDRLMGGALFVGAAAAGPAALVVLSLVDPKNEATKLLAPAVDNLAAKARGTAGRTRQDLLVAAHAITVLSCFFDAVSRETQLELTDEDRHRIAGMPENMAFVDKALNADVPFPSVEFPMLDNLNSRLRPLFAELAAPCLRFMRGLAGYRGPESPSYVVERAATLYLDRMLQLGPKPPFALWLTLIEHGATQHALGNLEPLLRYVAAGSTPTGYRADLANAARAVLDEHLLRNDRGAVLTPTVRDGFVEPAFQFVHEDEGSIVSSLPWWTEQPVHEGLVDFLAAHLAGSAGTELPLLVLGDPGAGKSLLTEVLAARLPAESFAVLRVPLREINPSDSLPLQITRQLRRVLQIERAELKDLRHECGPCAACTVAEQTCSHQARLVVLLDGFDELVQATGVTQSGYLNAIAEFQKKSRDLRTPVAVIVTSRTVVADRAEIPKGTPIVRINRFDQARIERWTTAWNAARAGVDGFVPLSSEALLANSSVAELVRDPLLLLVLAIYLAELGQPGFGGEELTSAQLYQRLLDTFIARQVDKDEIEMTDTERARRRRNQRRELQLTAFGMFNRGKQHITHEELDSDLAALIKTPERAATFAERLTEAQRVLSEFLFLHNASIRGDRRGTYEFLHATFGEYLVAELITTELARFAKIREADEETRLDDSLLSSLLAHEPVSQRAPVLQFARELAGDDPGPVLESLLHAARHRPDSAEDRYCPVAYDPVRRRATYLANLVLLRVHLDELPVPIGCLAESTESWAALVHLWRAGLPEESWGNVMGALLRAEDAGLIASTGSTAYGPDVAEADLAGDLQTAAARVFGHRLVVFADDWSDDDLTLHSRMAALMSFQTATPGLSQLLPFDREMVEEIISRCDTAARLNRSSRSQIGRLLGRDAGKLPVDVVHRLVVHALEDAEAAGLTAAVVAHPQLLTRIPDLATRLSADQFQHMIVVVALWAAEHDAPAPEVARLRDLREGIDRTIAADPDEAVFDGYFTPEYLRYLRQERPVYWTGIRELGDALAHLDAHRLRSIRPEDAVFVAGEDGASFAGAFLDSHGVPFVAGQEITALREYAPQEAAGESA
jgi:hypothetical protein